MIFGTIYAGASAVAIGTSNFIDPFICPDLIDKLEKFLEENNINSISDISGAAWK